MKKAELSAFYFGNKAALPHPSLCYSLPQTEKAVQDFLIAADNQALLFQKAGRRHVLQCLSLPL